eukprot:6040055-Prymnesium_polylepis.1
MRAASAHAHASALNAAFGCGLSNALALTPHLVMRRSPFLRSRRRTACSCSCERARGRECETR